MYVVLYFLASFVFLMVLGTVGGGSDDAVEDTSPDQDSMSVSDDNSMSASMEICFNNTMDDVGGTSAVDTATTSELNAALSTTLMLCGTESIETDSIGSGYTCDTDGCYDRDGTGYPWTQMATRWACTISAEMCDAARSNWE